MTTIQLADALERGEHIRLLARVTAGTLSVDDMMAAFAEHDRRHWIRNLVFRLLGLTN